MKAILSAEEVVKEVCKSVNEAIHTPIVLDIWGSAEDMVKERDAAIIERLIRVAAEWNLRGQSGGIIALDEKFYSVLSDLNGGE